MSAETSTNLGGTKEEFGREYQNYNPAPAEGPMTEILGTVLNPENE